MKDLATINLARLTVENMQALLATPASWCRGALATNAAGDSIEPEASDACSWCLLGAEMKATSGITDEFVKADVRELLYKYLGRHVKRGLATFNDDPATCHDDILLLLRQASDELRKA